MPKKQPAAKKPAAKESAAKKRAATPRPGGSRVTVENSGLEVWVYDEANRDRIAKAGPAEEGAGGMPPRFEQSTKKGLIVGYSLHQDDGLDVEVHVGGPFTEKELRVGRWLEPQHAWLRLPSGTLCIESNDASRVGPEEPGAKGATVTVPPGDYEVTLLRVDHEALDREGLAWSGAQEVLLLTPGGRSSDAAGGLLPFEHRRDTAWVGKHSIDGTKADALVWLGDYWDTFFVNLDAKACARLGLETGRYFRTHVPKAGLTMVSVFGPTWEEARQLPPPSNIPLDEYGYGAVSNPQDWAPHEALFCRREKAATRAEDEHQNLWLPATIEVLDPARHPPRRKSTEVGQIDLASQQYFDDDFLTFCLGDFLPGSDDLESLPLRTAIEQVDAQVARLGLSPQGDIGWTQNTGVDHREIGVRLYAGAPDAFAALIAAEGRFEFVFLSEREEGTWVVTGLADELEREVMRTDERGLPLPHPRIRLTNVDAPVPTIRDAHTRAVGTGELAPAPTDFLGSAAALTRFLTVATSA